ncbi:MAG TPA: family 78 glycoside hydrolase catalytic domain [Phycisphaerae bacterium]|nr:family 78 glycoside hydrolase catalytic domain [Phycisphaerae bacterium]
MKRTNMRLLTMAAGICLWMSRAGAVTVGELRVENHHGVVTVDQRDTPRLGWAVGAEGKRGVMQGAYRVVVASSAAALARDEGDLWDSGRVAGAASVLVVYGGKALAEGQVAYWKVKVWDQNGGESAWSETGMWRAGMARWEAKWIGFPGDDADKAPEAAPCFRHEFSVRAGLVHATAYVCGLGQYDLQLNGQKVGPAVLAPGWTNYARTCLYDTYDVTQQVREGANAVGVMLGNGMYNVLKVPGRYTKFVGTFGPPKVIAEIVCEYADGRREVVGTDGSWRTARGPVVFNHIYGGEDEDARKELEGWDAAGFADGQWKAAAEVEAPGDGKAQLVAAMEPAVVQAAVYPVVKESTPREGVRVFDFGQNMSGRPRLKVKGAAGAVVRLVPGELLGRDGQVTQRQSGSPEWFEYTCKGGREEVWAPRFSYYGFRYVQATVKGDATITGIDGIFTHADLPPAGTFKSSDATLNQIHTLINMAILSNAQSVLTDCPHREKLGWLEQGYLVGDAIMMNWDVSGLYAKTLLDMREAQTPDGLVPDIAPEYTQFAGGFRDAPEWGSAVVLDPWLMYTCYGDKGALANEYDAMKAYVGYLRGRSKEGIVGYGLGDWFDIGPGKPGPAQLTSLELTGTATFYRDLETLAAEARVLGKTEDAATLKKEAAAVKAAFNAAFFHADTGVYEKGSQTALAMPLAVGLVPDGQRARVLDNLVKEVRDAKNRVTAGDVGFSYVVKALTDGGRGDVLLDMALQGDGPGYVDQLRKGATTLTEAWDANPSDSQNHLMLGHIEAWFYRGLAGIQPVTGDDDAGFGQVTIAPQVVGTLQWVEASVETVRGKISSAWKKENGGLTLRVEVPGNVRARVVVPAEAAAAVKEGAVSAASAPGVTVLDASGGEVTLEVGSGTYVFRVDEQ